MEKVLFTILSALSFCLVVSQGLELRVCNNMLIKFEPHNVNRKKIHMYLQHCELLIFPDSEKSIDSNCTNCQKYSDIGPNEPPTVSHLQDTLLNRNICCCCSCCCCYCSFCCCCCCWRILPLVIVAVMRPLLGILVTISISIGKLQIHSSWWRTVREYQMWFLYMRLRV